MNAAPVAAIPDRRNLPQRETSGRGSGEVRKRGRSKRRDAKDAEVCREEDERREEKRKAKHGDNRGAAEFTEKRNPRPRHTLRAWGTRQKAE